MHYSTYKKLFELYIKKSQRKINKFQKKYDELGFIALFLFTAIPLPVTGAYSATLISWLTNLNRKKSIISISLGLLCSSIIIFLLFYKVVY